MKRILPIVMMIFALGAGVILGCDGKISYDFEPYGDVIVANGDVAYEFDAKFFAGEHVDYYAESYIDGVLLNRLVDFTERAVRGLNPDRRIVCYISKYLSPYADHGVVYVSEVDGGTKEHLLNLVEAFCDAPYGLIYAMGGRINRTQGLRCEFKRGSGTEAYLASSPYAASLQLPDLFDVEGTARMQQAALDFGDFAGDRLRELCLFYSREAFDEVAAAWVNSYGLDYFPVPDLVPSLDVRTATLTMRSEYVDFVVPMTFFDAQSRLHPGFYDYERSFAGMARYIVPVLSDIADFEASDYAVGQSVRPVVCFSNVGYVQGTTIYADSVRSVFELYLEYRLGGHNFVPVVRYLTTIFSRTELFYESEFDRAGLERPSYYAECLSLVGDSDNFLRDFAFARAFVTEVGDPLETGEFDRSFVIFLVERFGINKLLEACRSTVFDAVYKYTYEELTEMWHSELEEEFSRNLSA